MDATVKVTQHDKVPKRDKVPQQDTEWSADDLLDRLQRGSELFILDIRDDEEFERFKIEGVNEVPAKNICALSH